MTEPSAPATRSRALAAACAGAALAAALIVGSSGGSVDRMTFGDGVLFRYVAQHLTAGPEEVEAFLGARGPALRYGRIGFPAVLWLASGGANAAMPYVQPALMIVSAAAAAAAAATLLGGRSAVRGFVPFVALGFTASLAGGFAEPPALALCLWGVFFATRRRWWPAAALFAAAMLMRENAVLVVAGVSAWLAVDGHKRALWMLVAAAVPVVAWHGVVWTRFGTAPLLDPWLTSSGGTGPPVVELWRSLGAVGGLHRAQIAVHVVVAVLALRAWRSSPVAAAAAASALAITWTGPYVWRFIGDGARAMTFLDALAAIALVSALDRTAAIRETAAPARR